jgi:hypothetical protein
VSVNFSRRLTINFDFMCGEQKKGSKYIKKAVFEDLIDILSKTTLEQLCANFSRCMVKKIVSV